jgi:hypothetical protein
VVGVVEVPEPVELAAVATVLTGAATVAEPAPGEESLAPAHPTSRANTAKTVPVASGRFTAMILGEPSARDEFENVDVCMRIPWAR